MARLYNTFEFIGNINIPKDKEKFHDIRESASGWVGHRLNFGIQESKTNSAFVELYGGYSKSKPNKVFTFSKSTENEKGSKLEIPWDERLNPETLDMVADFKKIVVDFTTDFELKNEINQLLYQIRSLEYQDQLKPEDVEKLKGLKNELAEKAVNRHEFIHNYDAIEFLSNNLEEYKNYIFRLTGSIDLSASKGKFYRKFNPELIEIVEDDTPSQLRATMDIFFTKDSIDEKDFKKDKKVYINGYVIDYDNGQKKDQFYPTQFVINAQKLDFENETHVKRFEFLKNKFNVKGKGVYHLQWVVNIFRGADTVEFTIDDLTVSQREAIEFGFNKLEDFAPKGGMLGETVYENRLVKPILELVNDANDFREGAVGSTYELDDLEFVFTQSQENKPEENNETKEDIGKVVDIEKDLDDLFA